MYPHQHHFHNTLILQNIYLIDNTHFLAVCFQPCGLYQWREFALSCGAVDMNEVVHPCDTVDNWKGTNACERPPELGLFCPETKAYKIKTLFKGTEKTIFETPHSSYHVVLRMYISWLLQFLSHYNSAASISSWQKRGQTSSAVRDLSSSPTRHGGRRLQRIASLIIDRHSEQSQKYEAGVNSCKVQWLNLFFKNQACAEYPLSL